MKVKKAELMAALELVKPGLASKDIIAQSTSFVFTGTHLITYNDEIAISLPFESEIEGAVRAKELHSLLSKIKDDELDIEAKGNELIIKGKKKKAGVKLETEITLPMDEFFVGDSKITRMPDDFLYAANIASKCAASDMSKPILTCICIDGDCVYASNDFTIIRATMESEFETDQILVPAAAIKFLVKYDVVEVSTTNGWVHFHTEDELIFSSRTYAGDFPDVDEYLEVEGEDLQFPNAILEMLDTARVFTADATADEFINIVVENKKMTVKGEGEFGWFEEVTNCRYNGDRIEFGVDPAFLVDILKDLKKCVVGENTLLFQGENFDHVVSLVG